MCEELKGEKGKRGRIRLKVWENKIEIKMRKME